MLATWIDLMKKRGVYVDTGTRVHKSQYLIDIIVRHGERSTTHPTPNPTQSNELDGQDDTEGSQAHQQNGLQNRDGSPAGDYVDTDSEKGHEGHKGLRKVSDVTRVRHQIVDNNDHKKYQDRGLGIQGLMKASKTKEVFSGGCDEKIDDCLGIYETLAKNTWSQYRSKSPIQPNYVKRGCTKLFLE